MTKVAIIGAGKMGLSHLSILGADPSVEIVGVCDTSKMVTDFLGKYSNFSCFSNYEKMIDAVSPEAVVVAVPTKYHHSIIKYLLTRGIHVFGEKPFCLNSREGSELVEIAISKGVVNQVGYHNKFIGTFREVKRLLDQKVIGEISHFTAEAYGPVVTMKKKSTWRSDPKEGGGCLLDYASHVIDLVNYILSPVNRVQSAMMKSIFSETVEDCVYAFMQVETGESGVLSVNWSDDTYRKMSTSITLLGSTGKIISDANELKVYLREPSGDFRYTKGWNVSYITDLTPPVDFYLRGEEYSAQLKYFIDAINKKVPNNINTFESAWKTDKAIELIKNSSN